LQIPIIRKAKEESIKLTFKLKSDLGLSDASL
jgi:hypothetical protein